MLGASVGHRDDNSSLGATRKESRLLEMVADIASFLCHQRLHTGEGFIAHALIASSCAKVLMSTFPLLHALKIDLDIMIQRLLLEVGLLSH